MTARSIRTTGRGSNHRRLGNDLILQTLRLQRLGEFRRGSNAIGWRSCQRSGHHALEGQGYIAPGAEVGDRLGQSLGDDDLGRRAGIWRLTGEHLVEHAAERVDIGTGIEVPLGHGLLGTHVLRSADAQAGFGQPFFGFDGECLGNPEVRNEGVRSTEQDVLRLDVAVDHAVLVGVRQCIGDFAGDAQGVL